MSDLPRVPIQNHTIGRTFTAPSGVTYRPSMFVTLTLPSYGKVIPGRGIPVHPGRYDWLYLDNFCRWDTQFEPLPNDADIFSV